MQVRAHFMALTAVVTLAGTQIGCQNLPLQHADMHADEEAVRAADLDWAKAAASKDVAKVISYYADDAAMYPPNAPMAAGKPALKVAWTGMVNLPGFMVSWVPSRVEVARSGDLAWSTGTYNLNVSVPGTPSNDHGKYVAVWKKQSDGSWKVEADIFNSDMPSSSSPVVPSQQSRFIPPE
jgi:ketosteroid isomerase-like protein